jgi:hypothetical protein
VLYFSDLPGTPLSRLVVSREPFSDPPPPNRAGGFPRTRLSNDAIVFDRTRLGWLFALAYLCSLSIDIICFPSPGSGMTPIMWVLWQLRRLKARA